MADTHDALKNHSCPRKIFNNRSVQSDWLEIDVCDVFSEDILDTGTVQAKTTCGHTYQVLLTGVPVVPDRRLLSFVFSNPLVPASCRGFAIRPNGTETG